MRAWPGNPVVYEINTWVWLAKLYHFDRDRHRLFYRPAGPS